MAEFISKHKKTCIIVGIALAVVLLAIYLRAMFLPGLWHGDAFLYKQNDGSFAGSDIYAEYKMDIKSADYGTDVEFSVNDDLKNYQIKYSDDDFERKVEITENNEVIFTGTALAIKDGWILRKDNNEFSDQITVYTDNNIPHEALFPGYTKLYDWAVSEKADTRGNPGMLFLIALFSVILFLDIKFPTLFWILEHRLEVDGGEPSDWYLFGQKVGRVVLSIGILVCVILTFTIH